MNNRNGFVLIIVLLVTALLVSLVISFVSQVYLETGAARASFEAAQGSLYAAGGVQGAQMLLQQDLQTRSYSTLDDIWARPLELNDPIQGRIVVNITEENSKLNLNAIVFPNGSNNQDYYDIGQRLLQHLKLPLDPLDAIADWIDEDSTPHPGGAEADWYQNQPYPALPRNRPIVTIEELKRIKGVAEIYNKIFPYVTVYGEGRGSVVAAPININTAPKLLLMALDDSMTESLADRIISYRIDTPFEHPAELARVPGMEQISTRLQTRISVKGTVYRIRSEGIVGGTVRAVEAVVRISGNTSYIIYWREY